MKDILLSCSPLGEFIGTNNSHDIAKFILLYMMSYCIKKCIIPMHTSESSTINTYYTYNMEVEHLFCFWGNESMHAQEYNTNRS